MIAGSANVDITENNKIGSNAQDTANDVKDDVLDINSDNRLTPTEKIALQKEWKSIQLYYQIDIARAEEVDKSNYIKAYDNLKTVIEPFFVDMKATSDCDMASLNNYITVYNDERNKLNDAIDKVITDAVNVATEAGNNAEQAAEEAQKDAEAAKKQAQEAYDKSLKAIEDAGFSKDHAKQALDAALQSGADAIQAGKDAVEALNNAKNALKNINDLDQTVKTEITNINDELSQKVSQDTYDGLAGTVKNQSTLISQNKNEIALKADTSIVNTIKGTVDKNTAAILVNTNGIKLKADQSTVNTLTGRVTTAEGKLIVQAGQISQTVSKTELTGTLGNYATQTWTQGQIKSTADQINLSVTKVQSNLDNLATADRNLLLHSATWEKFEWWSQDGAKPVYNADKTEVTVTSTHGGPKLTKTDMSSVIPNDGDNVILSVEAKGTGTLTMNFRPNGYDWIGEQQYTLTNNFKRYYFRFKWKSGIANSVIWFSYDSVAKPITMRKPKLVVSSVLNADWSPAPEDMATEAQFSQLQVTVNGIQGTVQNKADQSQVTQLANQWSVTVDTLGQKNLIVNSEFDGRSLTDWANNIGWYASDDLNSMHNGSYGAGISVTNDNNYHTLRSKLIQIRKRLHFSFSIFSKIYTVAAGSLFFITFEEYDTNGKRVATKDVYADVKKLGVWQYLKFENYIVADNTTTQVRLSLTSKGNIYAMFSQPMLVQSEKVGAYVQDTASSSALAVTKDTVMAQVTANSYNNLFTLNSDGLLFAAHGTNANKKIILSADKIIMDSKNPVVIQGASIADASIATAKIRDLDAAKITTGSINAGRIAAKSITADKLQVANLESVNATTGNLTVDKQMTVGDNGKISSKFSWGNTDEFQPKFIDGSWDLSARRLRYDGIVYNYNNGTKPAAPSTISSAMFGAGFLKFRDYQPKKVGSEWKPDALMVRMDWTQSNIGGAGMLQISKDWSDTSGTILGPSGIKANDISVYSISAAGRAIAMTSGFNGKHQGDFHITADTTGGRIYSAAAYNRTYSGSANTTITSAGTIGRITSALKYKFNVEPAYSVIENAKKILAIKPSVWNDKAEVEAIASQMTREYDEKTGKITEPELDLDAAKIIKEEQYATNDDVSIQEIAEDELKNKLNAIKEAKAAEEKRVMKKYYGFIAEDYVKAGLEEVVIYDDKGEVEGLAYDRIPIYHNVILKDHEDRITELENKLKQMEETN